MFARAPCMCDLHLLACTPRAPPLSRARIDPRGPFARCAACVSATDMPSPDSGVARSLFLCSCQRAAGLARCAAGLDRRRQRRRACSFAAAPPGSLPRLRRGRAAGSVTAPFLGLRGSGRLAVVLPASRAGVTMFSSCWIRKIQSTLLQHCRLSDRQNIVTTMYLIQENRYNVTTMQNVVTLLQQYSEVFFL